MSALCRLAELWGHNCFLAAGTLLTPLPLHHHCRFPALFRLVKLWARTHECNDASRSTLNSTALMYMCIFFLQRVGVLPPLRMLCPEELTKLPKNHHDVAGSGHQHHPHQHHKHQGKAHAQQHVQEDGQQGVVGGEEQQQDGYGEEQQPQQPSSSLNGTHMLEQQQHQHQSNESTESNKDLRLLDPRLRSLWVRPDALDALIKVVEDRAVKVNERKQLAHSGAARNSSASGSGGGSEGGSEGEEGDVAMMDAHAAAAVAAVKHDLTQLLVGFLLYWEIPLGVWAEGRHRCAA